MVFILANDPLRTEIFRSFNPYYRGY